MFYAVSIIILGFLLDLLLGDPHWMPHPVRLIGWVAARLEALVRRLFPAGKWAERLAGAAVWLLVCVGSALAGWGLLRLAREFGGKPAAFALEVVFSYQLLATKALRVESMKVCRALEKGDLSGARQALSMIVGRDTAHLSPTEAARAAVETVAENSSDGIVAPLFFLMLGGAPLGLFYKAVNTLDSMFGYKDAHHLHFGWVSARMDDFCNLIPARLTALVMIVAAAFCGLDSTGAGVIWLRDRLRHDSPNSAQTEAACAGALGIALGGKACYGGVEHTRPMLGEDNRPVTPRDIRLANRLVLVTAFLTLAGLSVCKLLLIFFLR